MNLLGNPSQSQRQLLVAGVAALGVLLYSTRETWISILSSASDEDVEYIDETDYMGRAKRILRKTPLIDGHNDLPFLLRQQLKGKIYGHDLETTRLACHSDFQKMKDGMMGGQFWSVFVPAPEDLIPGVDLNDPNKRVPDLNEPSWAVRDTLEQIDITKRMVAQYPKLFELCTDPASARRAHAEGKIASMIGIEGGHQTGESLGALRLFHESGVRYMTITHNCDNAFATCWKSVDLKSGKDAGLSDFGQHCVREMNRLGMMVDLSHVSPNTMRDVLKVARAPVIFSHSGAYSLNKHLRNVPDDVIKALKVNGGIVMVPAVALFMNTEHPEEATIENVIDHILHVVKVAGWKHVGLGSDFDGTTSIVKGLEDTSQWPNLIAKLLARGDVSDKQAQMLVGENLLRVWQEVEHVANAAQLKGELPCEESWEGRLWEPENMNVPRLFAGS